MGTSIGSKEIFLRKSCYACMYKAGQNFVIVTGVIRKKLKDSNLGEGKRQAHVPSFLIEA